MKAKLKRLLSVLLVMIMVIGFVPTNGIIAEASTVSGTVYFDNSEANWSEVYIFITNQNSFYAMTKDDTTSYYKYDVNDWNDTENIIFTSSDDWNSIKSADYQRTVEISLASTIGKICLASGYGDRYDEKDVYNISTSEYSDGDDNESGGGSTDTPTTGTKKIYFDTTKYLGTSGASGWGRAYAYIWTDGEDGSGTTVTMNSVEGKAGFFYYDVPSSYTNIIFKPNEIDWKGQTQSQTIPSDKNLFTCTSFGATTAGTWGTYTTTDTGNNFPSNVTGKVTFFDLYTDTEIKQKAGNGSEDYGLNDWGYYDNGNLIKFDSSNYSFTSIGRAFSENVNPAIKLYWKNTGVSPLYFGNFQPYYKIYNGSQNLSYQNPWWVDNTNFKAENSWDPNRQGYMDTVYGSATHSTKDFSYYLNRSIDIGDDSTTAKYGAVVKGIVGDDLVDGNIVEKNTKKVLPQFNPEFYQTNPKIGEIYQTMEFPFVVREIDGADYYQFDSGVNGSSNRDTVRMNDEGTGLIYSSNPNDVVYGITSEGERTPGFFPFNDPEDSVGENYAGTGNKLNYGFGMKLEIEFTMDEDGNVEKKTGGKIPAKFQFSGDDDVWIFVDGKLALDMGGDHGVAQGELDFSKNKASVQYVKTIDGESQAAEALKVEDTYDNEDYINKNAKASEGVTNVNITDFEIDKSDPTEIHTLTIFYEERGMFESNFKATFNLEQPTVLKTTNTVNVDNVNPALQNVTATKAANDAFTFEIKDANGNDVTGKKYTTASGTTENFNGTMTLKNGESATFIKQFDRETVLELIQAENDKYDTSWTMSELSDSGLGSTIAASYQEGKNSLVTGDGRVDGKETSAFKLENADDGVNQDVPAEVQVDYVQTPKTGGIAIMKAMADGNTSDTIFEFTVKLSNVFGGGSAEAAYDLTYDVYSYSGESGESSSIVRKNAIATDGVVQLKAGQFALVNGIPVGTKYRVVEENMVGYSVKGLDVTSNWSNDNNVSGDANTATVNGVVVEDKESNVDMFVYTNGAESLTDSFLIEEGKKNMFNVIPDETVDGELTGNLGKITDYWVNSEAENKGFVFVVDDQLHIDEDGKPSTTLEINGVSYSVDCISGKPVITVIGEPTGDEDTITIQYQLVELNGDGTVKYKEQIDPETGNSVEVLASISPVITATNYFYKANDDIYVLDYGLDVDLAEETGNGLFENDSLVNPELDGTTSTYWNTAPGENASEATADTKAQQNLEAATDTYGTITPTSTTEYKISSEDNPTITYSLNKFLEGKDYFNYGVMIQKADADVAEGQTSNRFRLNVTSDICIMPAEVVYYEDDFNRQSSTDANADSTVGIVYSGSTTAGSEVTITQSNNQSEQYGHDEAYASGTTDSAGSSTALTADGYNTKAVFTFTGTGFDIIARTNDKTASIVCIIEKVTSTETSLVKTIAVDTYYANGDLYQIPVIHEEDLEYGKYQVTLGIKETNKGTVVYLDGIRIYNPLGEDGDTAYIDNEEGATITKISDLILGDGTIIESGISVDGDNTIKEQTIPNAKAALLGYGEEEKTFKALGYSKTENMEKPGQASVYSVLTYLNAGPNNELYLDDEGILAFVVEEDSVVENKTLQIEAKLLNLKSEGVDEEGQLDLCIVNEDAETSEFTSISSSTAMYYEIPVDDCIKLSDGKYLVAIQGNFDPSSGFCLSFSNLKFNGYTISNPLEDEKITEEYIETTSYEDKAFNGIDELNLKKRTWYTEQHVLYMNKDVFVDNDPEFKMYYVTANGTKKEITVTATKNKNATNAYNLTFKSPNAVGEFKVEIYYVLNGAESEEYLATSMSVSK